MELAQALASALNQKFSTGITPGTAEDLDPTATVEPSVWPAVAQYLKAEQGFDLLSCVSGVDWPDKFQVVYHLESVAKKTMICIKVNTPRENPSVPSVAAIWPTADWHERETFDLFGIQFAGHPDLRRIFMPDDWIGYPLRKDYETQDSWHGYKEVHPFKGKLPKNYKPGRGLR